MSGQSSGQLGGQLGGPFVACAPDRYYRIVDGLGATVSVVRRYLERPGLPAGWYIDVPAAHSLVHFIGSASVARQVVAAQAAALGITGAIP